VSLIFIVGAIVLSLPGLLAGAYGAVVLVIIGVFAVIAGAVLLVFGAGVGAFALVVVVLLGGLSLLAIGSVICPLIPIGVVCITCAGLGTCCYKKCKKGKGGKRNTRRRPARGRSLRRSPTN